MIYEYCCAACGQTFIGDGEPLETHEDCPAGENSYGELVQTYNQNGS